MPAAVRLRTDFSASELRRLAATTKNANQSRRLLSLAAVLDGMNRTEAAAIGEPGPAGKQRAPAAARAETEKGSLGKPGLPFRRVRRNRHRS